METKKYHECEIMPKDIFFEYDNYREQWEISDGSCEYGIIRFFYCPWCGKKL